MKNLFTILTVIIASISLSSSVSAQYSIPAYDVEIITEPTTFEEGSDASFFTITNATKTNFIQVPPTDERRKMNVKVETDQPGESASATIVIYSLDGENEFGPFSASDDTVLEQEIDERNWGVRVTNASEGCEVSVWIN